MEDILVYDELEGEFLGYYFSSTKMFIRYADGSTFENVTHWMPLSSFRKKLKLQLGSLRPAIGMFGKAEIQTNVSQNSIVIPFSALVEADGETGYIFTPKGEDRVRKVPVTILKFDNKNVYLKDKLGGIERIVTSNSAYLNEQSTIKIIK